VGFEIRLRFVRSFERSAAKIGGTNDANKITMIAISKLFRTAGIKFAI